MRITQAQRAEALNLLTVEAIKHNIAPLSVAFKEVRKLFWDDRDMKLDAVVKLSREDWAKLIQVGCINGVVSAEPEAQVDGHHGKVWTGVGKAWFTDSHSGAAAQLLLAQPGAYEIKQCIRVMPTSLGYNWIIKSDFTRPRIYGHDKVEGQLLLGIEAVDKLLREVIAEAAKFRVECEAVLFSCKTLKQLEDLFPEAAKLIPQPERKRTDLIPVEAAKALRLKLAAGVPPKQAA